MSGFCVYLCAQDTNATVKGTQTVMLNSKTTFQNDAPTKNTDRASNFQKEMNKFLRNEVEFKNLKHRRRL
jgi:chemotaxis receptor (MCP) glutamine deamidase CheD